MMYDFLISIFKTMQVGARTAFVFTLLMCLFKLCWPEMDLDPPDGKFLLAMTIFFMIGWGYKGIDD